MSLFIVNTKRCFDKLSMSGVRCFRVFFTAHPEPVEGRAATATKIEP